MDPPQSASSRRPILLEENHPLGLLKIVRYELVEIQATADVFSLIITTIPIRCSVFLQICSGGFRTQGQRLNLNPGRIINYNTDVGFRRKIVWDPCFGIERIRVILIQQWFGHFLKPEIPVISRVRQTQQNQ